MRLYLMRHAEAEKIGDEIKTDAERFLTAYGQLQAKAIAGELKRRTITPAVVTSPLRRAAETGDILCSELGLAPPQTEPLLTSTGYAPNLQKLLDLYPKPEHLLFIGHQPDIGMLVGQVLGFEMGFGTAAIAAFERQPQSPWRFLWTHTPEELLEKR